MTDVTLAILAGGAGSRMGMPKAWLKIDGRPILDSLIDHLAWPGPTMLVTAPGREHPPGWERFGVEIVSDPAPDGGPLLGILTALAELHTPLLLILTVDMPGVRRLHCKTLLRFISAPSPSPRRRTVRRTVNDQTSSRTLSLRDASCRKRRRRGSSCASQRRTVHSLLEGFLNS